MVEERDKVQNYENNKKFITDKLKQLKMAQEKKYEKERRNRERAYDEKKLEFSSTYETVVKNSKNMQNNIKNEQNKVLSKTYFGTKQKLKSGKF